MDVLSIIKDEHREVSKMMETALKLEPGDPEMKQLAIQIETALSAHLAVEEPVFYASIRKKIEDSDDRVDVAEGYTEHEVARHLIDLLKSKRHDPEVFKAELQVLTESVKHHVKEEESTIFSLAKKHFTSDELEALGIKWQAAKKRHESASARTSTAKSGAAKKR